MKIFISIGLVGLLFLACSDGDGDNSKTAGYFKGNLKKDMDYNAIVRTFGTPARDIGSGIHIYVYILDDSTEIRIGYTDTILYATHNDANQQLLEVLI
ncbi:MAG: hypothetical protein C0490_28775 [Marivirga sp.]|nr:hypothetical protein [Marivirga sp.]